MKNTGCAVATSLKKKAFQLSMRHLLQGPETHIREAYEDMTIYFVQFLNAFYAKLSALSSNDFIHSSPSIHKSIISEVDYS